MRGIIKEFWASAAFEHHYNQRQVIIISSQQNTNRALGRAVLAARRIGKPLNVIAYHYRGVAGYRHYDTGKRINRRMAAVFTYNEIISEARHFSKSALVRRLSRYVPTFNAMLTKFMDPHIEAFQVKDPAPDRPPTVDIDKARAAPREPS